MPSGTVSLLFSAIEGATVRLSRSAQRMQTLSMENATCCARHGQNGGTELGTEGDSFMVVFPPLRRRWRRQHRRSGSWPGSTGRLVSR